MLMAGIGGVMDSASKIAFGIVGGAVVLLVGFIGYHEFERQRDIAESQAIIQNIAGGFAGVSRQSQQQVAQQQEAAAYAASRQQEARIRDLDSRVLTAEMRCVGGVVLRVQGSVYTQLGAVGDPVRCSGDVADRAVR